MGHRGQERPALINLVVLVLVLFYGLPPLSGYPEAFKLLSPESRVFGLLIGLIIMVPS